MSGTHPLRLFFALWPDDSLRERIDRRRSVELASCSGRLVAAEDLHLTLYFSPSVEPPALSALLAGADRLSNPAFEITLDRLGSFPSAKANWLGPSECPVGLRSLVERLRGLAQQCELPVDPRAFKPHLTLQRKTPDLVSRRLDPPLRWPVTGFCLVQSDPGPTDSSYTVLRTWPLGARRISDGAADSTKTS